MNFNLESQYRPLYGAMARFPFNIGSHINISRKPPLSSLDNADHVDNGVNIRYLGGALKEENFT